MQKLFLSLLFFCATFSFGQVKDSLKYREDQFYVNINFGLQAHDLDHFQQNGFSRSIHIAALRDYPLTKRGDKAIAFGLGYGYVHLVNNIAVDLTENAYSYSIPEGQRGLRNVFRYHQLHLPLELRWRTSTSSDYTFWRVYLGYRLSHQFGAVYDPFFGPDFPLKQQLNPWQHSLGISMGFNTWNLRLDYSLTPLLKSELRTTSGSELTLFPVQIGLIFYLL